MGRARIPWVASMALLIVSCGADQAVSDQVEMPPDDVWGGVFEGSEDGRLPLEVALEAFEVAIGDLPGVAGSGSDTGPIRSGSGAVRWTLGHWDDLSDEQRAAVDGLLRAAREEPEGAASWPLLALQTPAAASEVDETAILGLISQIEGEITANLGRELGMPIELHVAPELIQGNADAFVVGTDSSGSYSGTATTCHLTITKKGMPIAAQVVNGVPSDELSTLVAHEVAHCFELALGTVAQSNVRPSWVVEGLAEWIGVTVGGGPGGGWDNWLLLPFASLFDRTYTAVGFYAHIDEHGADMWATVDPVILASDSGSESAYTTAIAAAGPDALATWGPGTYRDPARAPAWDQDGPGIKPMKYTPLTTLPTVTNDTVIEPQAEPLAAEIWDTGIDAQVVTITGSGHGMILLPDDGEISFPDGFGSVLCTDPAGCTCPEGTPGAAAIFRITEPGEIRIGLTGHLDGTTVEVRGWDLDDFCEEHEPTGCMVGLWAVTSYSSIDQEIVDGSGGGIVLTIDSEGHALLDFDDSLPILSRFLIEDAPWVQVRQQGEVYFTLDPTVNTALVGTAVGVGYHIAGFVQLDGEWIQGGPGLDFSGAGAGPGSELVCDEDTLTWTAPGNLSEYVFDRITSDAEDVPPPPTDGDTLHGSGAGGESGGLPGPPPPDWAQGIDACALLTLDEVQTLAPTASGGEVEDDVSTQVYRQCTYEDAFYLSVQPPTTPDVVETGVSGFDIEIVVVDGIGEWARAFLNEGDPTFGITEGSVFMMSAGSSKGTVNLLSWAEVIEGTPEYQTMLDLLGLALSRLP